MFRKTLVLLLLLLVCLRACRTSQRRPRLDAIRRQRNHDSDARASGTGWHAQRHGPTLRPPSGITVNVEALAENLYFDRMEVRLAR